MVAIAVIRYDPSTNGTVVMLQFPEASATPEPTERLWPVVSLVATSVTTAPGAVAPR